MILIYLVALRWIRGWNVLSHWNYIHTQRTSPTSSCLQPRFYCLSNQRVRRTHRRTRLRVRSSSASRLLNFTDHQSDVSTWFQMAPDSISEHANSKIFLGERAPRLP